MIRKVVYISTLTGGGPVSHLLELAPHVARRGLQVHVVCADGGVAEEFQRRDLPAVVVPIASKWRAGQAGGLWPALAGADIVHSQDRRAGFFGRILGRARGAAVVHTYHGLPEDIAVQLGRHPAPPVPLTVLRRAWLDGCYFPLEAALARLGVVITPSIAMSDFLAAKGVPRSRLRVVPSAIEVRRDQPGDRHHPPRVAVAANLERWKGLDVLLEACAGTGVHVDVYGDGSARAALEAQAAAQDVDVTFHGRVADVPDRLRRADMLVLPSRAENLPVSILEAMAAALPVIATRVGGVPELVVDGETGLLVPPDNPGALRAAILRVAGDEALRRRLGEAGAKRARTRFAPELVVDQVIDVYEQACASFR